MYCAKCGKWNPEHSTYCIGCGTSLSITSPTRAAPGRSSHSGTQRWLMGIGIALLSLGLMAAVAGIVAYFWLGFNRREHTARIVPADTAFLFSISPNPRQALRWRDVENLEMLAPALAAVPGADDTAQALPPDLFRQLSTDWQTDILPWIGPELSLALMTPESEGWAVAPPFLLTASTRNTGRSDAFLKRVQKALEQEGASFGQETYQGVTVTYMLPESDADLALAFATFDHLVVLGSSLEALHQGIDGSESPRESTLAGQETYERVMATLPNDHAGYIYLDGPQMLEMGLDTESVPQLEGLRAVGVSFGLVGDGIRLDAAVSFDPGKIDPDTRNALQLDAVGLRDTARIPSDAIAYLAGQDLPGTWSWLSADTDVYDQVQEGLDDIESETGVDFQDTVVDGLTEEFRVALLTDRAGLAGDTAIPMGILLRAQAEETARVRSGLDDLVTYFEGEGASLDHERMGKTDVTLVLEPDETFEMGFGFAGRDLVFGTSRQVLDASLSGDVPQLGSDAKYRATIEHLPARSGLVLYVDVESALSLAYEVMDEWERADFDEVARPYVQTLRAAGMGLVGLDESGIGRATLFLLLKPQ